MDKNKGLKRTRWLSLLTAVLLLGMLASLAGEAQPATAQTGTCMSDECGVDGPCSANDVSIATVSVYSVTNYCTEIGDTGTYQFLLEFVSTAAERYDPTAWIALDGVDAYTGECYKDFLTPPLAAEPPTIDTTIPRWGFDKGTPYWDLEDTPNTGDECGDIVGGQTNYKITDEVTVQCTAGLLDGTIDTVVAWQINNQFVCTTGACPGSPAKCNAESVPFEVKLNPVDIGLTKAASEYGDYLDPGETFLYTLTVTNNETDPDDTYDSSGYEIFDDLPIWLKVVDDVDHSFPEECDYYEDNGTSDDGLWGDNTAEFCAGTMDGCDGYGDIIYCNEQDDLDAGASRTYSFYVKFWNLDEEVEGYCDGNTTDPRCLGTSDPTENPEFITNEACVLGFDREDPALSAEPENKDDNCGTATTPTEVQYLSFTATGEKKAIVLDWETNNEIDNLGFNIYRATSEDGDKTKINQQMIPGASPGGTEGAVYSYTDPMGGKDGLKPNVTYYYWLEDVPVSGTGEYYGPAYTSLTLGQNNPKKPR